MRPGGGDSVSTLRLRDLVRQIHMLKSGVEELPLPCRRRRSTARCSRGSLPPRQRTSSTKLLSPTAPCDFQEHAFFCLLPLSFHLASLVLRPLSGFREYTTRQPGGGCRSAFLGTPCQIWLRCVPASYSLLVLFWACHLSWSLTLERDHDPLLPARRGTYASLLVFVRPCTSLGSVMVSA